MFSLEMRDSRHALKKCPLHIAGLCSSWNTQSKKAGTNFNWNAKIQKRISIACVPMPNASKLYEQQLFHVISRVAFPADIPLRLYIFVFFLICQNPLKLKHIYGMAEFLLFNTFNPKFLELISCPLWEFKHFFVELY